MQENWLHFEYFLASWLGKIQNGVIFSASQRHQNIMLLVKVSLDHNKLITFVD
jgi:hypothetical protein